MIDTHAASSIGSADELYKRLNDAVSASEATVFRTQMALMPAAGWTHPIVRPPVYTKAQGQGSQPTLIINTVGSGDQKHKMTLGESYEARAHRMSEAIRSLQTRFHIELPVIEFYYDDSLERLVCDSFTAPHHVTDACWREAVCYECQKPFYECTHGKAIVPVQDIAPASLLRLYPMALLTGYDPRSSHLSLAATNGTNRSRKSSKAEAAEPDEVEHKNLGVKRPPAAWGRIAQSSILVKIAGAENEEGEFYRAGGVIRPWDTTGQTIYVAQDGGWTTDETKAMKDGSNKPVPWPASGEKKDGAPASIGLETVPPSRRAVPDVWVEQASLHGYLTFGPLRKLRFSENDKADSAAKRLVAALGLAGLVLAENELSPRADCDFCPNIEAGQPLTRHLQIGLNHYSLEGLKHEVFAEMVCRAVADLEAVQGEEKPLWDPQTIKLYANEEFQKVVDRDSLRRQR